MIRQCYRLVVVFFASTLHGKCGEYSPPFLAHVDSASRWLVVVFTLSGTRHVFAIRPVLTIAREEGRRIAPCKFEANAPVRLPLRSSYWGGDGMTLMATRVVVPAEGRIQRVEKTGKFKLGNTGGEGLENQSLQDLGKCTGAFTVAMAISGR